MIEPLLTIALPFAGAVVGGFACTIALLCGDSAPAFGAFIMAAYCAAEFVVNVDVT